MGEHTHCLATFGDETDSLHHRWPRRMSRHIRTTPLARARRRSSSTPLAPAVAPCSCTLSPLSSHRSSCHSSWRLRYRLSHRGATARRVALAHTHSSAASSAGYLAVRSRGLRSSLSGRSRTHALRFSCSPPGLRLPSPSRPSLWRSWASAGASPTGHRSPSCVFCSPNLLPSLAEGVMHIAWRLDLDDSWPFARIASHRGRGSSSRIVAHSRGRQLAGAHPASASPFRRRQPQDVHVGAHSQRVGHDAHAAALPGILGESTLRRHGVL